ncbi:hypothetical protein QJS10_CPB14g01569 [Acorus calamus]|uniref:F-box protein At3g26010-like beta-propeller domain-containing protein n=1 Tax=Acorus calamus TaxID=4465 RepID=A0AAV9DDU9_ACOCL|nr:hypothetical protein QJS10_CPB14g01569 [Acorus calamus]
MRLPRKPLCRLKCLSASFNRWITVFCPKPMSGIFYNYCLNFPCYNNIRTINVVHYAPVPPPGGVRSCWDATPDDGEWKITHPELSYLPSRRNTRILDCRRGLLLCCHAKDFTAGRLYFVCNPLTERWVALPRAPHAGSLTTGCLAFDPREPKRYSVVQLAQMGGDPGSSRMAVDVFSAETGEWAEETVVMDLCIRGLVECGKVIMNGAVHALARNDHGLTLLLAYHVKDGRAWTMSLPDIEYGDYKREWLGESSGDMRYVISIKRTTTLVFKLSDYVTGGGGGVSLNCFS